MSVTVRTATDADWNGAWPIIREVSRAGDTFTYPTDMDEETALTLWREPRGRNSVAVSGDDTVLGISRMGANRGGPGAHVATASFMVDGGRRGLGVGRALVVDALAWSRAHGFRSIQFNSVASTNTSALALYETLGFSIVGTVPEGFLHPELGYVPLHSLYLKL